MSDAIGFIGLGVMGEPICRNLVRKSGRKVFAFDLAAEPLAKLAAEGAMAAGSLAELVGGSETIFLCLPSAKHVLSVFEGILPAIKGGQTVIDVR